LTERFQSIAPLALQQVLANALALEQEGNALGAFDALHGAIAQTGDAPTARVLRDALAVLQFRSGQYEQARQTLQELIDEHAQHLEAASTEPQAAQFGTWPGWAQAAWSGVASSASAGMDWARIWRNLGACHVNLLQAREAEWAFAQAYALSPQNASSLLYHYGQSMANCEWSRWPALREEVISGVLKASAQDDLSASIALFSAAEQAWQMQALAMRVASNMQSQLDPVQVKARLPLRAANISSRLRVGYFSCDFRNHAVGHITQDIFALHDRQRVEIYALSYGPNDGSAQRAKIAQDAEHFVELHGLTALQMVQQIRQLELNVVVDLSGNTSGALPQVMLYRVAPIQCHWLGYLWSMGSKAYDYLIADPFSAPERFHQHYQEAIVQLPHSLQVASVHRLQPSAAKTRQELGLKDDAFVMAYFGALSKLTPTMFDAWLEVLRTTPHAVLWIGRTAHASTEAFGRLRARAMLAGIHPLQLLFSDPVAHEVHLARYALVDVVLDPFPVGSGVTAVEALWMGCPIVSMAAAGETLVSRMPGAVLQSAGLKDWVVDSVAQYQALLQSAAHDRSICQGARAHLLANRMDLPLFDTQARVQQLEAAFEVMHQNAKAGQRPSSFSLSA
jgi:protein O-GlcNAc transferase